MIVGGSALPVPAMTFSFGMPPSAAATQAASPPIAIPTAKDANISQDGNGSLVRPALLNAYTATVI